MTAPKESVIDRIDHTTFAWVLETPLLLAFFVNLAPPSQSHEEPSRDILDNPEIERAEDDDDDEGDDVRDDASDD